MNEMHCSKVGPGICTGTGGEAREKCHSVVHMSHRTGEKGREKIRDGLCSHSSSPAIKYFSVFQGMETLMWKTFFFQ